MKLKKIKNFQTLFFLFMTLSFNVLFGQSQVGSTLFGPELFSKFGESVALSDSGDIMAVGAGQVNEVKVFHNEDGVWSQLGASINGSDFSYFGSVVRLSGDGSILAVAADFADINDVANAGTVKVYKYNGNDWIPHGNPIEGDSMGYHLGYDMDLSHDGSRIVVGIPFSDRGGFRNSGEVRVFDYNGSDWIQIGENLHGDHYNDQFGRTVRISDDGTTIVVAAHGFLGGKVKVFRNQNSSWTELGQSIESTQIGSEFGFSLAINIDGNTIGIGAPSANSRDGVVYIYEYINDAWTAIPATINGPSNDDDQFGFSLDFDSNSSILVVGSYSFLGNQGRVSLYKYGNGNLTLFGDHITDSQNAPSNRFGSSVSISSEDNIRVAIGGPGEATNLGRSTIFNGFVEVYNISHMNDLNTSGLWSDPEIWSLGEIPTNNDVVELSNKAVTVDVENAQVFDLTLDSNSELIIRSGKSLTVFGNLTNDSGIITIESEGSLIVYGQATGDIEYVRNIPSTNWHLISTPFAGVMLETIIQNHVFATGTGDHIGISNYNNDIAGWEYFTSSSTGVVSPGNGYAVKLNQIGDLSITGQLLNNNHYQLITHGSHSAFNLIGNPYPSYLNSNTSADTYFNSVLGQNAGVLEEMTIWYWNQENNSYQTINHATAANYIPPLQGFFVKSNSEGGMFVFNKSVQSHQTTDTFRQSEFPVERPEIKLQLSSENLNRCTEVYYIEGTTTGFDNGYDSTLFSVGDEIISLYTHLVSDSQGEAFSIQSLPNSNYENMIVPVGVKAPAGAELLFSANVSQFFPSGIEVFLEDRENDVFVSLSQSDSFYRVRLENDISDIGRFFLHTTYDSSLSLGYNTLESNKIRIYKNDSNTLIIDGLPEGETKISLYNLMGQQIINTSSKGQFRANIPLQNIKPSLYILNLKTGQGEIHKKIIL